MSNYTLKPISAIGVVIDNVCVTVSKFTKESDGSMSVIYGGKRYNRKQWWPLRDRVWQSLLDKQEQYGRFPHRPIPREGMGPIQLRRCEAVLDYFKYKTYLPADNHDSYTDDAVQYLLRAGIIQYVERPNGTWLALVGE